MCPVLAHLCSFRPEGSTEQKYQTYSYHKSNESWKYCLVRFIVWLPHVHIHQGRNKSVLPVLGMFVLVDKMRTYTSFTATFGSSTHTQLKQALPTQGANSLCACKVGAM